MDDRLLASFMTVAECGSFTVSAEKLSVTQSALSRQIQSIEQTLGVELFERTGKKIRVSPEGEALRARINEVLIATKNLRLSAEELKKGEAGVLNLLNLIDKEMRVAMTLTGAARVSDLDESFLERGSVAPRMERQGALS